MIGSRDWQDFLDALERLTVATESIANSLDNDALIERLARHVKRETTKLEGALPTPQGD